MTFSISGTAGLTFPNSTVQASAAAATNFQEFTSTGTFTPSAALLAKGGFVNIILVGAGGGARSGSISTTGTPNSNGIAGGGGEVVIKTVKVTGATTVTIGTGGTGGAAVTASTSTAGNVGTAGGNSTFGTLAKAYGGGGGDTSTSTALGKGGGAYKVAGNTTATYNSDNSTLSYGGTIRGASTATAIPDGWASGSSGLITSVNGQKGGACFITGAEGGAAGTDEVNNGNGAGGNPASNANASSGTSATANSGGGGGGGGSVVDATTTRTSGAGGNGGAGYCLVSWVE
jgi:hypothetical protein